MRRGMTGEGRLTGICFLLMTLAGWASSPLFLKYFVGKIDAWSSNGWRYGIAALFWLPIVIREITATEASPGLWRAALWPTLFNATGQICFAWVLYLNVDPGMMTFLLRTQIVAATIGAFALFPDERGLMYRRGYWFGMVLVVGGIASMILLRAEMPVRPGTLGMILGILSGALFGGYALAVRRCMSGYSSMTSFAVISLYTSIALILPMLLLGDEHGLIVRHLNGFQLMMLVISALAGIALGHVFYYASIARLGVALASGILLLQPFVTASASAVLYGERLTGKQWISGTLSVIGAVLLLYVQTHHPRGAGARSLIPLRGVKGKQESGSNAIGQETL
jgi:drug/metabolite transporter (DMT)-like permease